MLQIDPTSSSVHPNCQFNINPANGKIIVGRRVVIGLYSRMGAGPNSTIEIGSNVFINQGAYFNCDCSGKLTIEDECQMGPYVTIWCGNHEISDPTSLLRNRGMSKDSKNITIRQNVWIGAHVSILDGVEIGENSIIGAGSVVTKDIPSNCIAVGNPAKAIKIFDLETKQWKQI